MKSLIGFGNSQTISLQILLLSHSLFFQDSTCMISHFFSFFFFFLGPHPWHMAFPRVGVQSELQLPAYATAMQDLSRVAHRVRPGIEPATSWFLVGFISAVPQQELHDQPFQYISFCLLICIFLLCSLSWLHLGCYLTYFSSMLNFFKTLQWLNSSIKLLI